VEDGYIICEVTATESVISCNAFSRGTAVGYSSIFNAVRESDSSKPTFTKIFNPPYSINVQLGDKEIEFEFDLFKPQIGVTGRFYYNDLIMRYAEDPLVHPLLVFASSRPAASSFHSYSSCNTILHCTNAIIYKHKSIHIYGASMH